MIEEIKITKRIFISIRDQLVSEDQEDFTLAMETWKNLNPSIVLNTVMAKYLFPSRRKTFRSLVSTLECDTSWVMMWEEIKKHDLTKLEKEIIEEDVMSLFKEMMKFFDIEKVITVKKIEMKW